MTFRKQDYGAVDLEEMSIRDLRARAAMLRQYARKLDRHMEPKRKELYELTHHQCDMQRLIEACTEEERRRYPEGDEAEE